MQTARERTDFRAWYAQALRHSHLHLLLLLLSAVRLSSSIELLGRTAPLPDKLGNGVVLLACIASGWRSGRCGAIRRC